MRRLICSFSSLLSFIGVVSMLCGCSDDNATDDVVPPLTGSGTSTTSAAPPVMTTAPATMTTAPMMSSAPAITTAPAMTTAPMMSSAPAITTAPAMTTAPMMSSAPMPVEAWTMAQVMDMMFHIVENPGEELGKCNGCHIGGDTEPPVFPREPDEFYTMVTTFVTDKCFDYKLVEPGEPSMSALVLVLAGECEGGFKMPVDEFGGPTPDQLEGIKGWISAGAPH